MTERSSSNRLRGAGSLAGRLLLRIIFVWFGYAKATSATGTIGHLATLRLPVPTLAYAISVTIEVVAGLLFMIGSCSGLWH